MQEIRFAIDSFILPVIPCFIFNGVGSEIPAYLTYVTHLPEQVNKNNS
jgi:hypothetical protein